MVVLFLVRIADIENLAKSIDGQGVEEVGYTTASTSGGLLRTHSVEPL